MQPIYLRDWWNVVLLALEKIIASVNRVSFIFSWAKMGRGVGVWGFPVTYPSPFHSRQILSRSDSSSYLTKKHPSTYLITSHPETPFFVVNWCMRRNCALPSPQRNPSPSSGRTDSPAHSTLSYSSVTSPCSCESSSSSLPEDIQLRCICLSPPSHVRQAHHVESLSHNFHHILDRQSSYHLPPSTRSFLTS